MRRYISSDIERLIHRVPRWIILAFAWLILIIVGCTGDKTLYEAMDGIAGTLSMYVLIFGIIEIVFVYGDDLKAKTMQIAIGSGMPRQKVVHAKWLEFMIVTASDFIIVAILALISQLIWRGTVGGFNVSNYIFEVFMSWLSTNVYLGSIMFIMFWMQGISMTLLVYIIAAAGVLPDGVEIICKLLKMSRFHLHTYLLTSVLQRFEARALLGHFNYKAAIGILLYMMIGFALASILFKKKELEF